MYSFHKEVTDKFNQLVLEKRFEEAERLIRASQELIDFNCSGVGGATLLLHLVISNEVASVACLLEWDRRFGLGLELEGDDLMGVESAYDKAEALGHKAVLSLLARHGAEIEGNDKVDAVVKERISCFQNIIALLENRQINASPLSPIDEEGWCGACVDGSP